MCFSATASYVTSALLLLCGIGALYRAKKNQLFFAAMPLLFAIQQFIEGAIWQSLTQGSSATVATSTYICFVFVVWPTWIPFSIYRMSNPSEKKALGLPMIAGILTSILAVAYLLMYTPQAIIEGNHIRYIANVPQWLWIPGTALYLTATITPFFISKIRNLSIMGIMLSIAYIFTLLFYYKYLVSVWCFFVAILSALVLLVLR